MRILVKCFEEDTLSNLWIPYVHSFDAIIYLATKEIDYREIAFINKTIEKDNPINISVYELHEVGEKQLHEILKGFLNQEIYVQITKPTTLSCKLTEYAINKNLPRVVVDVEQGNIVSLYNAQKLEKNEKPLLFSLETMISIRGAKLIKSQRSLVDLDDNIFQKDIIVVFNIIKKAHRQWAIWMQMFTKELSRQKYRKQGISLTIQQQNSPILKKLREANILRLEKNRVHFKNDKIKKLFEDIGVWLEYYVYIQLEKTNQFNDLVVGGIIDYDGERNVNCDPTCEIDILCIKKYRNAFISCKMNKVDADALNEIKLHTLMFGNIKSKAILVTCANLSKENPMIYRKAQELG